MTIQIWLKLLQLLRDPVSNQFALFTNCRCPPSAKSTVHHRLKIWTISLGRGSFFSHGKFLQLFIELTDLMVQFWEPWYFFSDDTPFEGGIFKIKLSISKEYPSLPPKGHFMTKVFHPNVNPDSGEICVNTLKKDWTPNLGLKHILLVGIHRFF